MLLGLGAGTSWTTVDGTTALHVAAECGRPDMAAQLIECGARLGCERLDGFSPLHTAAALGEEGVVSVLLNRLYNGGAAPTVERCTAKGETPLLLAATE